MASGRGEIYSHLENYFQINTMPGNSIYMTRLPSSGDWGAIAADFQKVFMPEPPQNNSCKLIRQELVKKPNIRMT